MEKDPQDSIDLVEVCRLIAACRKTMLSVICFCALSAYAATFFMPTMYESKALVRARAPNESSLSALEGAYAHFGSNSAAIYIEYLKSAAVINGLTAKLQLDTPPETFAATHLRISVRKGTDIIEIAGRADAPEGAAAIANGLIAEFQAHILDTRKERKSAALCYLKQKIDESETETAAAAEAFNAFQKDEGVYIPEEQTRALLETLFRYDQMRDQSMIDRALAVKGLEKIGALLDKQNAALAAYRVAESGVVQNIRNMLVDKQIALIDLRQKYTRAHPMVKSLEEQAQALDRQLSREIEQSIASETNGLNPLQSELLKQKATSEIAASLEEERLQRIDALRRRAEAELDRLTDANTAYIKLSRKLHRSMEAYDLLVKNYEQETIRQVMNSMDIEVIDEARPPSFPSSPRRTLFAAVGAVAGAMLSAAYIAFQYQRAR